jgi:enoyl-CoA hydratase/carnithine racemase
LIRREQHEHVVIFTLQGDSDLNLGVIGPELYDHLAAYRRDAELRCAVITGAGTRSFSAGADLKQVAQDGFNFSFWSPPPPSVMSGEAFWKPLVAAVNGYALGIGLMLALACDIRIATRNATFGFPEVKYGFPPFLGATQRLPRQIALGPAMEMLLTGDPISAEQAEKWGLVNRLVEHDALIPEALALAKRIAANPPLGVQASKELAWRALDMGLEQGLRMESMLSQIARNTEDAQEGPRAFAEKRAPHFKGR